MAKTKLILIIIIISLLIGSNVYLGWQYFNLQEKLRQTQARLETQIINTQVLYFTKLFINKVLKAEEEVDFETRLQLENAVRNLADEEILNQWNRFVASKTEEEAQIEVKNLLEILIEKIKIK